MSSEVVEAGWMSTSVHVAIKEMGLGAGGGATVNAGAKDPFKEVPAMQYLQGVSLSQRPGIGCARYGR